jgi:hypothetical protein
MLHDVIVGEVQDIKPGFGKPYHPFGLTPKDLPREWTAGPIEV